MSNPKFAVVKHRRSNGVIVAVYEYEVRDDARAFAREKNAASSTFHHTVLPLKPGTILRGRA